MICTFIGEVHIMADKILVGFATKSGSTKEVAEAVAQTLREAGLEVDFVHLRDVSSLAGYKALVLGAPLYMFHWNKDALNFLKRHRKDIEQRPAAVFALGPFNDVAEEWKGVREQLDKELAKFPWFTPVAIAVFGGKFDPAALRFPYNLIPALKSLPASDIRDWTAIRAWGSDLATRFQSA